MSLEWCVVSLIGVQICPWQSLLKSRPWQQDASPDLLFLRSFTLQINVAWTHLNVLFPWNRWSMTRVYLKLWNTYCPPSKEPQDRNHEGSDVVHSLDFIHIILFQWLKVWDWMPSTNSFVIVGRMGCFDLILAHGILERSWHSVKHLKNSVDVFLCVDTQDS